MLCERVFRTGHLLWIEQIKAEKSQKKIQMSSESGSAPESFEETAQLIDARTESTGQSYGRVFVTWENSEITLLIMGVKDWPLNTLIARATSRVGCGY